MHATKTKIIQIGNSQGVRIPRNLLEQAGIAPDAHGTVVGQEVELEVGADSIILRRTQHVRAGWEEEFARMAEQGDDVLLDDTAVTNAWDEQEWVW